MRCQPGFELIAAVDAFAPDLEERAAAPEASELVQIANRQAGKLGALFGGEVIVGSHRDPLRITGNREPARESYGDTMRMWRAPAPISTVG
jgi:hypothetical protein